MFGIRTLPGAQSTTSYGTRFDFDTSVRRCFAFLNLIELGEKKAMLILKWTFKGDSDPDRNDGKITT